MAKPSQIPLGRAAGWITQNATTHQKGADSGGHTDPQGNYHDIE